MNEDMQLVKVVENDKLLIVVGNIFKFLAGCMVCWGAIETIFLSDIIKGPIHAAFGVVVLVVADIVIKIGTKTK